MLQFDVDVLDRIAYACKKYPERAVDIAQSFKKNQLSSKNAVCTHIPSASNGVCVLGGWYGMGFLLLRPQTHYTFVDIDPTCKSIGDIIWNGKAEFICADALQYNAREYDTIINCSTEHMDRKLLSRSFNNISPHSLCIFQNSNNDDVEDHINCFTSADSFREYLEDTFIVMNCMTQSMDNSTERYTAVCIKTQ